MPDTFKPLFNRNLLQNRIKGFHPDISDHARTLVSDWVKTVSDPMFRFEKEKPYQGQFLEHVFSTVLGYTHAAGHLDDHHLKVETSGTVTKGGKTPDGLLGFYGKSKDITRAVIELKSPNTDLELKQKGYAGGLTPVEQAFGYAPKFDGVRWVIVSNFRIIRLYSTIRGQAYRHEFKVSDFKDEARLNEFVFLMHKDRLIAEKAKTDSFTEKLASETYVREEKITRDFYSFYREARLRLFHQLVEANPIRIPGNEMDHEIGLIEKTQKIFDRVLFICFCEDTGLLPAGVIRKAIDAADQGGGFVRTTRWSQITGLFHSVDKGNPPLGINGYNGGLFAPDHELDSLLIPDSALDDCLRLSSYDYETDLNVNILGHIFEQSISDLEALRAEVRGDKIDRKTSKRKKEGVFYTPDYITRFIVENTLGSWLRERFNALETEIRPEKTVGKHKRKTAYEKLWTEYRKVLKTVKVLDPACGSGAFLVAAFDYLHAENNRVNQELAALRGGQTGIFDLDKQILQDNIFGVDINKESVEITKLSLWLKTADRKKPLNNLDGNIKQGDSLIDPNEDFAPSAFAFQGLPDRVKERAFDWKRQFPQVHERGGFDCVIGNPPYIRQEWISPLKKYLETRYRSFSGTADIYMYFIEQGLHLAKPGGKLGYITSGTFSRAKFAAGFRKWLPTVARFDKIINFGENQPFEDAEMVYPTISILHKDPSPRTCRSLFIHEKIPKSLENALEEQGVDCSDEVLEMKEWVFQDSRISYIARKFFSFGSPLKNCQSFQIYYGVKTGLNDVFVVNDKIRNELVAKDPSCNSIIKKVLGGEDLRPWYQEKSNRWLIFTRRGVDIENYPLIKEYLEKYRAKLEPKPPKFKGDWRGRKQGTYLWYEIQDAVDYHSAFEKSKLFWPDIAKLPRFSIDETGAYLSNTGYILTYDSPWILSILQSRVTWFCISQIATPLRLRGGLWQYRCINQFIQRLPVPDVPESDRDILANLALRATQTAEERYQLHESVRHRILTDLGNGSGKLNKKLFSWWETGFTDLRKQVKKAFKTDIPLKERAEWEQALDEWRNRHDNLTTRLIDVEAEINDRVYRLFDLSKSDIKLLEDHMKRAKIFYPLGAV